MLTIDTQAAGDHTTIQLQGELQGHAVEQLEREWRHQESKGTFLQVNLCRVQHIDDCGKKLLREMFCEGVGLIIGPRGCAKPEAHN
jgi:ABC-type transporter Mla MlaB component